MTPYQYLGCLFFLYGFGITILLLYSYVISIEYCKMRRKLQITQHNRIAQMENDSEVQVLNIV